MDKRKEREKEKGKGKLEKQEKEELPDTHPSQATARTCPDLLQSVLFKTFC